MAASKVAAWCCGGAETHERIAHLPLPNKEDPLDTVAFGLDGKTIAIGYNTPFKDKGQIELWDLAERKLPGESTSSRNRRWLLEYRLQPRRQNYRDRVRLRRADTGGVLLWDLTSHKVSAAEPLPANEGKAVFVTISPDGRSMATACTGVRGGVVL